MCITSYRAYCNSDKLVILMNRHQVDPERRHQPEYDNEDSHIGMPTVWTCKDMPCHYGEGMLLFDVLRLVGS